MNSVGGYLKEQLGLLAEKYDVILERRGEGLMQGLEFKCPVAPYIKKALEHGLILINAGEKIIRFIPPLIIKKHHVDEMIKILSVCLEEKEREE